MIRSLLSLVLLTTTLLAPALAGAQTTHSFGDPAPRETPPVEFERDDMSGPRFGMTYVIGAGEIASRLKDEGMERALSQFGWHFERRVTPRGGGPEFVVETVPMVSGVEYGKVIPNLTVAMGVRFPQGWEFGIGPNLIAIGAGNDTEFQTSLVTAAGYTFRYSGVNLPVNLAVANNPEGTRVSLVLGYAIRR